MRRSSMTARLPQMVMCGTVVTSNPSPRTKDMTTTDKATRPITHEMLVEAGACEQQLTEFGLRFGRSVVPTHELAVECADKFDWRWAANRLLSIDGTREYNKRANEAFDRYMTAASRATKIDDQEMAWVELRRAEAFIFVRLWIEGK